MMEGGPEDDVPRRGLRSSIYIYIYMYYCYYYIYIYTHNV